MLRNTQVMRSRRFVALSTTLVSFLLFIPGSSDSAGQILGTRPSFRTENSYRVMTNDSIEQIIERVVPRFVDPSGRSLEKTPGLVIGFVTKSGTTVLGFGTTKINGGRKPNGSTCFGIGSVTKIFVGFILAEVVSKNMLKLDDSANQYLRDDLKLPSDRITLRHLATHTSGLPNFPENIRAFRDLDEDGKNDSDEFSPGRNYTRALLAGCLKDATDLEFEPGARGHYSNLGIGILSMLLQEKLGFSSFEDLNRAKLTGPLRMSYTLPNTDQMRRKAAHDLAQGYAPKGGRLLPVPHADMGVLDGSGELVSRADDLIVLLKSITGLKPSKLSAAFSESMRPLAQIGDHGMGYGFKITPAKNGGVFYSKPGGTAGYSAVVLWRTDPKIGIVILANRGKFDQINRLGTKLVEAAVQ